MSSKTALRRSDQFVSIVPITRDGEMVKIIPAACRIRPTSKSAPIVQGQIAPAPDTSFRPRRMRPIGTYSTKFPCARDTPEHQWIVAIAQVGFRIHACHNYRHGQSEKQQGKHGGEEAGDW